MKYIIIGQIINVRGIRGEIKIKPLTSDVNRFAKLKVVYIDGKPYRLRSQYLERDFVYMGLIEVKTRTEAELLKGKFLEIDEVNAVVLDEGEYFIADLVGMLVVTTNGEKLGYIESIDQFGAADVFTVNARLGKKIRFPFLNKIVSSVDTQARQFIVFKDQFDEVAVYDE